jgi:carbonic anhydrase
MSPERGCACCSGTGVPLNRRWLLGGGTAAALLPLRRAWAYKSGAAYEAMLLSCIDPRMHVPVAAYMGDRDLTGKYSKYTVAGAAIGVVAPAFEKWHQTFWDNLAASIELHKIKTLIAIDHRDCGAARIAYGDASIATPQAEDATHRAAFAELRKQLAARHPGLGIETILMDLDGSETPFA